MPSTRSLADKLALRYPDILFCADDEFRWSPTEQTIFYREEDDPSFLLHELAHALLGHATYARDMELVDIERDAWVYAKNILAYQYDIEIEEDDIQDGLDTYREWLHARSTCPNCRSTGVQVKKRSYRCVACHTSWRVNDARVCALRRYVTN